MERVRIPPGRYSKEFREEAARLVTEGGLSAGEASARLSLPKSTLENWVRAAKKGKLGEIGKSHRPLTELEIELAKVKRELAIVKVERDILKKAAAYFAKESLHGMR
jgi:transposase